MPSTELDSARFTSIDWTDESDGWCSVRRRTIGLVLSLFLLAILFTYDYVAAPRELFEFMDWDVTRMDWLFLVLTVVAFNVFWNVVRDVLDPQEEVA